MRLILASTSRHRRALLDRLGIDYEALPHACDEAAAQASALAPEALAADLALAKAQSLRPAHPGAWILGSDQVLDLDGEVLGKPGSPERAVEQLARLQGRSHRLLTAACLLGPDGQRREALDVHTLRMRALDAAALARYVAADQPLDCCGSYMIEARGIALFESIQGSDFTAIVGLPMIAVVSMLAEAGFPVH